MNIEQIIKEDTKTIDVNNIELPASMQPTEEPGDHRSDEGASDGGGNGATTTLSLEQLAGLIIVGYNAVSCAIYRRVEPGFDASLQPEEVQAIKDPLETVLREYDVQVTPVTALIVAVIGVNAVKIMQLMQYRKELQAAEPKPDMFGYPDAAPSQHMEE